MPDSPAASHLPGDILSPHSILYSALSSPLGILLSVNEFDRGRRELYEARKVIGDARLNVLAFRATGAEAGEGNLAVIKVGSAKR